MRKRWAYPIGALLPLALLPAAIVTASNATAVAAPTHLSAAPTFTARVFASGADLVHATPSGNEALAQPDDITSLGSHIFVGFQNGVGPQGQASATGNLDSTIVEFNLRGRAVAQWDVVGKCDGLTANPKTGRLIATVNEDANSSVYLIEPFAREKPVDYSYNVPLPSNGGTDAISIYRGMTLISASAPGTTGTAAPQATYPAVYRVVFNAKTRVATVHPLFFDEALATIANTNSAQRGTLEPLALTDPDSNEVVPRFATRFAGDFMLTSQGDKQQIFVHGAGGRHQTLSVLNLSDPVDDTAWASDRSGAIYATDNDNNTINKITGPFTRGGVFVADTPCGANDAPSTCPAAGFPANYLGKLNPKTGVITPVDLIGPAVAPQGMLFRP
jgi:hypothetical protein